MRRSTTSAFFRSARAGKWSSFILTTSATLPATDRPRDQQETTDVSIRIAMIGAGSIGFTRRLMRDVLAVPELADTTFAFTDISQTNLDMVAQLCRRDIEHNNLPAKIV